MLIKILKPFPLKGTKYEPKQEIQVDIKTPFWRNRIKDKDVIEFSLKEYCEHYAKEKNKEKFEFYRKKYNDFLTQILDDISKIPDKLTPEQANLKKETNALITDLVKLEEQFKVAATENKQNTISEK